MTNIPDFQMTKWILLYLGASIEETIDGFIFRNSFKAHIRSSGLFSVVKQFVLLKVYLNSYLMSV